jgi:uncharacterized protein YkwD
VSKFLYLCYSLLFVLVLSSCKQQNLPTVTSTIGSIVKTVEPTSTNNEPTVTPTNQPPLTIEPTATSIPTLLEPTPTSTVEVPIDVTPVEVTPTPTLESSSSVHDCRNEADFLEDITIPDNTSFNMGDTFEKTWRIKNTGTCLWKGYSLVYAKGDIMNANFTNPIPDTEPGKYVDVSVSMIAPDRGGLQTGYWTIQNADNQQFGFSAGGLDLIWVQIVVQWPTAQPGDQPVSTPAPVGTCGATRNTDYENQILTLVNQARASQGLNSLVLQSQLTQAAVVHSLDMACNDFVDHNGSDGSTWYDRVQNQGYPTYITARENIYVGSPEFGGTPQGAFDWWMNSQVHRDNILYAHVSQIGIAYVYNPSSTYGGYYTMVLARP